MAQGWCNKSCVRGCGGCVRGRGRAACVDVAGIPHRRWQDRLRDKSIQCDYFFFNVVKEDIKCIEISSIDAVHNRTMTLAYELKGVNDAARGR